DAQVFTAGQPIAFTATASDLEDGPLTARLAWVSDRDGALGMGGAFSRSLSAGTHRITASVTDSGGLAGSAGVTVTVRAATTVEFPAVADTFVDAGAPASAFGTDPLLRVDANTL